MRILFISFIFALVLDAQVQEKQADVDRIFSGFNNHTPGCAVGVANHGKVVLKSGYGMADLERGVSITSNTVFESGSVAKQFTAMALLLLAQQGKISLDDPLRKYLPELPDYGKAPSIRDVLSHVSGIREWRPIATYGGAREGTFVYTNQDLLRMASRQRALNFDPGTHYSYTNTGFNISTILIERALGDGRSFQAFTQEFIFGPLGMTSTRWRDNFRTLVPNRALAYGLNEGKMLEQQTPIENIIGAGGLLTTVGDLLLWNENFTHAKVGGREIVEAQQTPARLTSGKTISYAKGLMVTMTDGIREVSHSGSTGGYRTWLGRYPDQGISIAVLCNSAEANPTRLGRDTARLWTGTVAKPVTPTHKADPAKVQMLAGMYRKMRDNMIVELRWQNNKLMIAPRSGTGTELLAVGQDEFATAASGSQYRFEQGPPVRMRVSSADDDVVYERVDPANPTPTDLAALAGEYSSRETEATLTISVGDKPGELSLRVAANAPIRLRPTFRDAFATPSGSSIFFIRDAANKVTALSAGEDRVWDLRFARVIQSTGKSPGLDAKH
jgi:CubicO group peptidase (beta-lactamase class C family)